MRIEPFPGGRLTRQPVEHTYTSKTGLTVKNTSRQYVLTDEQREWLCRWFPEEENSRIQKMMGCSKCTLHRLARLYGLKKSEAGMRRIKKRQAATIKRKCEENGYYDSLRGRQPSEACKEGAKRMWQEIRDGKREHPIRVLQRISPRKYRKFVESHSQRRKDMIRRDRARLVFGLPTKTRLRCLVLQPYTKSQTSHRHNALKRGYFFMEDCREGSGERFNIYYDGNTRRSELFERNLQKDGFRVSEYVES